MDDGARSAMKDGSGTEDDESKRGGRSMSKQMDFILEMASNDSDASVDWAAKAGVSLK